ncbi:MAG TPA: type II secretion system protein [Dehalococcoidia bacterium]|nr:type II secretion system protein [Dehalococcoidia bacterium]
MRKSSTGRIWDLFNKSESGVSFLETLIALAVLGAISVAFLSGLATTSRAAVISDRRVTAESLARSQMESVKQVAYVPEASQYTPIQIPSDESYTGFSVTITAEPLESPDDGVQKVTVTVLRSGADFYVLQGYKVDR